MNSELKQLEKWSDFSLAFVHQARAAGVKDRLEIFFRKLLENK